MTTSSWKPELPPGVTWVDAPLKQRFEFPDGWAEADIRPSRLTQLGDRRVPRHVHAHYYSVDDQPSLDLDLEVVSGRPQCRSVRITSAEGGREVKPVDIRWVELTKRITETFAWFALEEHDGGLVVVIRSPSDSAVRANRHTVMRARKGKTARKLTPDFYRQVAKIYDEHREGGAPKKAVAEAFGVSDSQANNYIRAARRAGILGPR